MYFINPSSIHLYMKQNCLLNIPKWIVWIDSNNTEIGESWMEKDKVSLSSLMLELHVKVFKYCLNWPIHFKWQPYLILLHLAWLCFAVIAFFFFYKLEFCGNPPLSESISAIFPKALSHFVSLCHILVILTIFQTFYYHLYLLCWTAIFDVIL